MLGLDCDIKCSAMERQIKGTPESNRDEVTMRRMGESCSDARHPAMPRQVPRVEHAAYRTLSTNIYYILIVVIVRFCDRIAGTACIFYSHNDILYQSIIFNLHIIDDFNNISKSSLIDTM